MYTFIIYDKINLCRIVFKTLYYSNFPIIVGIIFNLLNNYFRDHRVRDFIYRTKFFLNIFNRSNKSYVQKKKKPKCPTQIPSLILFLKF